MAHVLLALLPLALASEPPDALIQDVAERRRSVLHAGNGVLGGWAVANLAGGTVGWVLADDPSSRSFHAANAAWNVVNLGLALPGWLGTRSAAEGSWPGTALQVERTRAVFLLNLGLDAGYAATGAWLLERGARVDDPRLTGWGFALLLQAGFLAGFDLGMAVAVGQSDVALEPWLAAHGDGAPATVGLAARF